jgi:hypothetical protein
MKKLLAATLAAGMLVSLAPVQPAQAIFKDITDTQMQREVESLKMMDVINGMPDGTFQASGTLTRSQFCKMAVVMMGKESAVGQYKSFTIFPDVRASHWAAGYINLAVSGEDKIIAGYANGRFGPNDPVTFGQAVTILMRLLGYTDSDAGVVWPDGYLASAASIGLTKGVSLAGNAVINRGQAAKLFVNLLTTDKKGEKTDYIESRAGSLVKDTIVLSVDAKAADGTGHSVETTSGTYKTAEGKELSTLFTGQKGTLVLDDQERIMTFLTDGQEKSQTFTLSSAKSDKLVDTVGKEYEVKTDTDVYQDGEKTTYGEVFKTLKNGLSVTIYYDASGKVDYVFLGMEAAKEAMVLYRDNQTGLEALTGGRKDYQLYKNGMPAQTTDLRRDDVAIYDAATNRVQVSDDKLSGCFEDVYPNREAPQKLSILGTEFPVLPLAADSISAFKLGDQITILLTADGQVAGARKAEKNDRAYGIVMEASTDHAIVELLNGREVSGNPNLTEKTAQEIVGQLVDVSSNKVGQIVLNRQDKSRNTSDFQVSQRKVGNYALADNVRIFEKVGKSKLTELKLTDITAKTISADKVYFTQLDYADRVQILILEDAVGECYTYGKLKVKSQREEDGNGDTEIVRKIYVEYDNGDGKTESVPLEGNYRLGEFGGLAIRADGQKLAKVAELKEMTKVPNSAWASDNSHVTVRGISYPVAENVRCYNRTTEKWISLKAAKAFAQSANLYYDREPEQGGKIRIVEVEQ